MTDKFVRVRDVSLDIETLSTRPNAAILSIGAVQFCRDTYLMERSFYGVVEHESAMASGHVEQATVEWWAKQSEQARAVFTDPKAKPIAAVLQDFALWMREGLTDDDRVLVWGNGPGFDNAIVREAYVALGMQAPWRYSGDRDLRTMVDLVPSAPYQVGMQGTAHNALDDAIFQTLVLLHGFKILRGEQT